MCCNIIIIADTINFIFEKPKTSISLDTLVPCPTYYDDEAK